MMTDLAWTLSSPLPGNEDPLLERALLDTRTAIEIVAERLERLDNIERNRSLWPADFAERYAAASRPVVLTNAMGEWDRRSWDFDALDDLIGDCEVDVRIGDYVADAFTPARQSFRTTFIEYTAWLRGVAPLPTPVSASLPPPYLGNLALPSVMAGRMEYPGYLSPDDYGSARLWLGPAGAVTPLHQLLLDSFIAQVWGHKLVVLVSPDQREFIYPRNPTVAISSSPVDPLAPDLNRFPLFNEVHLVRVILEPNQMLFVPAGWFRHVVSIDLGLSIGFVVRGLPGSLTRAEFSR